ncbi:EGF-like calcium-binding [Cynara cardunculus var. scolymus]|uniref:EGF-like calcium-binding n=1 Tax=Cynara cardunculus var. scolymus TaxID=59895 RepID=A0A103XQ71_CYNCS|nr:EGF-like calcium-binding [Cynara cardunculus var. scolymus]
MVYGGNLQSSTTIASGNIAKQGCQTHCGNMTVPYPFGIGVDCALDESFSFFCNSTEEPPKLIYGDNIEVYIISDSEIKISNTIGYTCYNEKGNVTQASDAWTSIPSTDPFTFSRKNKFTVIGNRSCKEATECKGNSSCKDAEIGGYHCICNKGYEGNPYLDPGCQDIDECKNKSNCYGNCINTQGSYNCTCWPGYTGDATTADGCRYVAKESKFLALVLSLVDMIYESVSFPTKASTFILLHHV